MSNPSYTWVCHKCGAANSPGLAACSSCNFPAVATGQEIEKQKIMLGPRPPAVSMPFSRDDFLLFFPEIIPAAIAVVAAPFWAIQLLLQAHFLSALVLAGGISASCYAFLSAVRAKAKYLAYASVIGALLSAYLAHLLSQ